MQIKQQHLPFDYWGPRQLKYHQPSLHLYSHTLVVVWSSPRKVNWILQIESGQMESRSATHEWKKGEKFHFSVSVPYS